MRSKTDFVEKNAARQVETHMETNIVAQTLTACMKKKKSPACLYQFSRFNLFHMDMEANASAKAISCYELCGCRLG